MSKKTNAAKQKKLATTKRERSRRIFKKRRRNEPKVPKLPGLLGDPIFLHHVSGALLRYMELIHPVEYGISAMLNSPTPPPNVDAEFQPDTKEPGERRRRTP